MATYLPIQALYDTKVSQSINQHYCGFKEVMFGHYYFTAVHCVVHSVLWSTCWKKGGNVCVFAH